MLGLLEDKRNEFKENVILSANIKNDNLNKLQKPIIKLIMDKPNITQEELARLLDVNTKVYKNGYWQINKK